MQATDFIYDGIKLSDIGYIICTFDSSGVGNATAGSTITFNSVKQHGGVYHAQVGTEYEECFTTTFEICKNTPTTAGVDIPLEEYRFLMSWLNRREFCTFSLVDNHDHEWDDIYFEGSFNIEKILFAGRLIGLSLTFQSNRPFGFGPVTVKRFSIESPNQVVFMRNISDEIGALYPDEVVIKCTSAGDLTLYNDLEKRSTTINNCKENEIVTMDCVHQIISTSNEDHELCNDFNFNFFRLYRTFWDKNNKIAVSLPCEIKITYRPIKKVVF